MDNEKEPWERKTSKGKSVSERLRNRYEGAMTIYCVLFEDNKSHQGYQGDRRWSNWTNYDLVSDEAMSARPRVGRSVAKNRETQTAYYEWETAQKKEEQE